jgi:hypothetical protein
VTTGLQSNDHETKQREIEMAYDDRIEDVEGIKEALGITVVQGATEMMDHMKEVVQGSKQEGTVMVVSGPRHQYPEGDTELVRLLTGVESARKEYEQALDEVYDRLTEEMEVSVSEEVDAYRILKKSLPSFDEDKARSWRYLFKRAQTLTHFQLDTTRIREAMGMSFRVRNGIHLDLARLLTTLHLLRDTRAERI